MESSSAAARPSRLRGVVITFLVGFVLAVVASIWALTSSPMARDWLLGSTPAADPVAAAAPSAPQAVISMPVIATGSRAEGLVLANTVRTALDKGLGLGSVEPLFRAHFAGMNAVAVENVVAASRQPVTLASLRADLAKIGPDAVAAAQGQGWFDRALYMARNLIVLRHTAQPSSRPDARLEKAMRLLESGQVDAALGALSPVNTALKGWSDNATRYGAARKSMDQIDAIALQGQDPVAAPAIQPPVEPAPVPTVPAPGALPAPQDGSTTSATMNSGA